MPIVMPVTPTAPPLLSTVTVPAAPEKVARAGKVYWPFIKPSAVVQLLAVAFHMPEPPSIWPLGVVLAPSH
ncbi:hypothetical protein D3C71_1658240 [compost metagenome]